MADTIDSLEGLPRYLKWTLISLMAVFGLAAIVAMILSELRFPIVSVNDTNQLITDCKVAKLYEIGSPSARRPDRLRTIVELKDGSIMQTENGIHMSAFANIIKSVNCPFYTKSCDIGEKCEVQIREDS